MTLGAIRRPVRSISATPIELPVLEHCSLVWCSAADSHHKLLDRVVRGAVFLAGGVLDPRSATELGMLFKIRSNSMRPLCNASALPCLPKWASRSA